MPTPSPWCINHDMMEIKKLAKHRIARAIEPGWHEFNHKCSRPAMNDICKACTMNSKNNLCLSKQGNLLSKRHVFEPDIIETMLPSPC
jgi:hypothetical protein